MITDEMMSEAGCPPHCCCCGVGEPCCDCGMVRPSAACIGEICFCGRPAAKKIGEEILFDDPLPNRHNLTRYVCADHYAQIMGPLGARQVGLPEAMSTASQPPVGTVPYSDDHLGIDQPYAEDAVERVAAIIDPDAFCEKATPDGCGTYWSARRNTAREKARAAIQALSKDEGLRSALEARDAVIAAMADAIDEADNIISINCGTDTPKEWDRAFRRVQRARIKLSHREDI